MSSFRRNLARVACVWLCAQFAVLAAAPVSLWPTAPVSASDEVTCTCTHGPDAHCPMHHPVAPSKSGCNCRSNTLDPGAAAVIAMLGQTGVLTPASAIVARPTPPPFTRRSSSPVASWIDAPDGPPPRA